MSDPRYAHKADPNRHGLCKRIVGVQMCHLPIDDPVHTRWEEREVIRRRDNPTLEERIKDLEDWKDRVDQLLAYYDKE